MRIVRSARPTLTISEQKTKFEEQLEEYFPDIYRLHQLGKAEPHLWEAVSVLVEMRQVDATGKVFINYNRGHIDGLSKQVDVLAHKSVRAQPNS